MKGFSGFKNSPITQKVDPDAPGTPGTPGFEPPVLRSELDDKGKNSTIQKTKRKNTTWRKLRLQTTVVL